MRIILTNILTLALLINTATAGVCPLGPKDDSALRPVATGNASLLPKSNSAGTSFIPEVRQRLFDAIEYSSLPAARGNKARLYLTHYCNEKCSHCQPDSPFLAEGQAKSDPALYLTEDRLEEVIAFLNQAEVVRLEITGGGEPFFDDETIGMLLEIIRRTGVRNFSVVTNGLWAKDESKLYATLSSIIGALDEREEEKRVVKFDFTFSVDRWHDEAGIEGIVNFLDHQVSSQCTPLALGGKGPRTDVGFKITHDGDSDKIIAMLEDIGKRLARQIGYGAFDYLSILRKRIENGKLLESDPSHHPICFVGDPDGRINFLVTLQIVGIGERFKRRLKRRIQDIPIIKPVWKGHAPTDEFVVDTDGSVSFFCRDRLEDNAFVYGNVSEGYPAVKRRLRDCPILRAWAKKGSKYLKDMIETIGGPDLTDGRDNMDIPALFEEALFDEGLRTRLAVAILDDYQWDELTPESQARVLEFAEAEGIEMKHAASSSGTAFIPEVRQRLFDAIDWKRPPRARFSGSSSVYLTWDCNGNCSFCLYDAHYRPVGSGRLNPDLYMTQETLDEVIRFFNEAGVSSLMVAGGGEPLIDAGTIEMLAEIIEKTQIRKIHILSNGIWAKDKASMEAILSRIGAAILKNGGNETDIELNLAFSIDEYHTPGAIEGFINVIEQYILLDEKFFPRSHDKGNVSEWIIFNISNSGNPQTVIDIFEDIERRLSDRLTPGRLDLAKLKASLGEMASTDKASFIGNIPFYCDDQHEVDFFFALGSVTITERFKRRAPHAAEKVKIYPTDWSGNHAELGTYNMDIDKDGTVSAFCRDSMDDTAFDYGNASESFSTVWGRMISDPILRAKNEKGLEYLKGVIEKVGGVDLSHDRNNKLALSLIAGALKDEELRTDVALEIINDCFWNELTPDSQEELIDFTFWWKRKKAASREPALAYARASSAGDPPTLLVGETRVPIKWLGPGDPLYDHWRTAFYDGWLSENQGHKENLQYDMQLMLGMLMREFNIQRGVILLNLGSGKTPLRDCRGIPFVNIDFEHSDLDPATIAQRTNLRYHSCKMEELVISMDRIKAKWIDCRDRSVQFVALCTDMIDWLKYYNKIRNPRPDKYPRSENEIPSDLGVQLLNAWHVLEAEDSFLIATEPGCENLISNAVLFEGTLAEIIVIGDEDKGYAGAKAVILRKNAKVAQKLKVLSTGRSSRPAHKAYQAIASSA
ncbi:MAG: radical SAM protein [Candidatus Omnitrophica bacterium]|nr:radical SAM protein [Candidatus Omnitrophota bacterium]